MKGTTIAHLSLNSLLHADTKTHFSKEYNLWRVGVKKGGLGNSHTKMYI